MPFSNNNSSAFPPSPSIPLYRIWRDWCIGDSLPYLNANIDNLDTRIITISSFTIALSARTTPTINLNLNKTTGILSGFVIDQSINSFKLGGDVLQTGRHLLTSASMSALRDVQIINLENEHALIWEISAWRNRSIEQLGLPPGDKGDVFVNAAEGQGSYNPAIPPGGWRVTDNAITTSKISATSVTPAKLSQGRPFWNTLGNVGIGTDLPNQRLTVSGNISATGNILTTGTAFLSAIDVTNNALLGDRLIHKNDPDTAFRFPSNDTVTIETGGLERFRVSNTGNIGIDRIPSTERLEVGGAVRVSGTTTTNQASAGTLDYHIDTNQTRILSWGPNSSTNGAFSILTGPAGLAVTERFNIASSGNIGIGTTTPNQLLTVAGNISATGNISTTGNIVAANTTATLTRSASSNIINIFNTLLTLTSATTAEAGLMTPADRLVFEQLTRSVILSGQFLVDYLIVAGGGGSGPGDSYSTYGGAGAGGYIAGSSFINPNFAYTIEVGAGGVAGTPTPTVVSTNGSNSSFLGLEAVGGGRTTSYNFENLQGGSGGGGGTGSALGGIPGLGTFGQGLSGGLPNYSSSGGGGGAGTVGGSPSAIYVSNAYNLSGANGGNGKQWLDGNWYAGGGAGQLRLGYSSSYRLIQDGLPGLGGGGYPRSLRVSNSYPVGRSADGVINTGGGADGGGTDSSGDISGNRGGSGIVIIRYQGTARCYGGAYSYDSPSNYSYHIFNTSDILTTSILGGGGVKLNYLVVGGGGGAGGNGPPSGIRGGGGGAGGALSGTYIATSGSTYTVTIGSGGTGGVYLSAGNNGNNTTLQGPAIGTTAVLGGGGGGGGGSSVAAVGKSGGSGGGAAGVYDTGGGSGQPDQGTNGGPGSYYSSYSGGGGGARTQGASGASSGGGGLGITWLNGIRYADGGSGSTASTNSNSTPNTGNGGNTNESFQANGLDGASGVVVISYLGTVQKITGGNVTISNGYTHHTFLLPTDTFTVN